MIPGQTLTPRKAAIAQAKGVSLFIVLAILTSFLLAFPVKWLWNWLMPDILGLEEISAIQAWGLTLLLHLFRGNTQVTRERKESKQESTVFQRSNRKTNEQ